MSQKFLEFLAKVYKKDENSRKGSIQFPSGLPYSREKKVRLPRDSFRSTTHQNMIEVLQIEEDEENLAKSVGEERLGTEINQKMNNLTICSPAKGSNGKNVNLFDQKTRSKDQNPFFYLFLGWGRLIQGEVCLAKNLIRFI